MSESLSSEELQGIWKAWGGFFLFDFILHFLYSIMLKMEGEKNLLQLSSTVNSDFPFFTYLFMIMPEWQLFKFASLILLSFIAFLVNATLRNTLISICKTQTIVLFGDNGKCICTPAIHWIKILIINSYFYPYSVFSRYGCRFCPYQDFLSSTMMRSSS